MLLHKVGGDNKLGTKYICINGKHNSYSGIFLYSYTLVKRYLGIFFVKGDGIYNFTKGNQIRFCVFIR